MPTAGWNAAFDKLAALIADSDLAGLASSTAWSGELGGGPLLQHAVDVDVGLLVVEGDESGDLLALQQRRPVRPGEVVVDAVGRAHRPVLRLPLVRAMAHGVARDQQVEPDVRLGQVVAR